MKAVQEIFNDYLKESFMKGGKKRSRNEKTNISHFLNWLAENNMSLNETGIRQALAFQKYLHKMGEKTASGKYAANTLRSIHVSLICFFDFLKAGNLVYSNPFRSVRKVRPEDIIPRNVLKPQEMMMLLKELKNFNQHKGLMKKRYYYKAHVVAELMYATGLRINEAGNLGLKDIDFERGLVEVREGKGGIRRKAYLNDYACRVLKFYVQEIRESLFTAQEKKNRHFLFGVRPESLMDFMNRILKETCLKLNLPVITSHGFRHALGSHLLKAGCDIRYIQEILGHRKLASTEIYTKIEKKDLKRMLDNCHPRKWWIKK